MGRHTAPMDVKRVLPAALSLTLITGGTLTVVLRPQPDGGEPPTARSEAPGPASTADTLGRAGADVLVGTPANGSGCFAGPVSGGATQGSSPGERPGASAGTPACGGASATVLPAPPASSTSPHAAANGAGAVVTPQVLRPASPATGREQVSGATRALLAAATRDRPRPVASPLLLAQPEADHRAPDLLSDGELTDGAAVDRTTAVGGTDAAGRTGATDDAATPTTAAALDTALADVYLSPSTPGLATSAGTSPTAASTAPAPGAATGSTPTGSPDATTAPVAASGTTAPAAASVTSTSSVLRLAAGTPLQAVASAPAGPTSPTTASTPPSARVVTSAQRTTTPRPTPSTAPTPTTDPVAAVFRGRAATARTTPRQPSRPALTARVEATSSTAAPDRAAKAPQPVRVVAAVEALARPDAGTIRRRTRAHRHVERAVATMAAVRRAAVRTHGSPPSVRADRAIAHTVVAPTAARRRTVPTVRVTAAVASAREQGRGRAAELPTRAVRMKGAAFGLELTLGRVPVRQVSDEAPGVRAHRLRSTTTDRLTAADGHQPRPEASSSRSGSPDPDPGTMLGLDRGQRAEPDTQRRPGTLTGTARSDAPAPQPDEPQQRRDRSKDLAPAPQPGVKAKQRRSTARRR